MQGSPPAQNLQFRPVQPAGMPAVVLTDDFSHNSFLDERLEPREGIIPLSGDSIECSSRFIERIGLKLEDVFAPPVNAPDEAGTLEHLKVLGDRLAGEGRTFREPSDRRWGFNTEPGQERE